MSILRLVFTIFILILNGIIGSSIDAKSTCPEPEDIAPCKCIHEHEVEVSIICEHENIKSGSQLKQRFDRISRNTNMVNQTFYKLTFASPNLVDIPEKVTGQIKFQVFRITGECTSLKSIHQNAFASSVNTTFSILIETRNIPSNQTASLYALVNQFPHLTDFGCLSKFDTLDTNSFSHNLDNLLALSFSPKNIKGSPFTGMNNLEYLQMNDGGINYIPSGALKIGTNSSVPLRIWLGYNMLNSSSFQLGTFNDSSLAKKQIRLLLAGNQITYLDEKIFRPFFAMNILNELWMSNSNNPEDSNPLDCSDKRSAWICDISKQDGHRVIGAICTNGKHLTDCKANNFI